MEKKGRKFHFAKQTEVAAAKKKPNIKQNKKYSSKYVYIFMCRKKEKKRIKIKHQTESGNLIF